MYLIILIKLRVKMSLTFYLTSCYEKIMIEVETKIFMIVLSIQSVFNVVCFSDLFQIYSLHAVQELLTDKEKVSCEAEQYNAGDVRVHR
jgi:hypothetical protein